MALKGNDYKQSHPIKHQQNNNSQQTLSILYNLDFKSSGTKHKNNDLQNIIFVFS